MSYYELWNAGVMLAGMCSRYGQPGKFEKLGEWGHLVVETKPVQMLK